MKPGSNFHGKPGSLTETGGRLSGEPWHGKRWKITEKEAFCRYLSHPLKPEERGLRDTASCPTSQAGIPSVLHAYFLCTAFAKTLLPKVGERKARILFGFFFDMPRMHLFLYS